MRTKNMRQFILIVVLCYCNCVILMCVASLVEECCEINSRGHFSCLCLVAKLSVSHLCVSLQCLLFIEQ